MDNTIYRQTGFPIKQLNQFAKAGLATNFIAKGDIKKGFSVGFRYEERECFLAKTCEIREVKLFKSPDVLFDSLQRWTDVWHVIKDVGPIHHSQ